MDSADEMAISEAGEDLSAMPPPLPPASAAPASPGRSLAVHGLVNLYLLLFAADALLSVADVLMGGATGIRALSVGRQLLSVPVLLLAIPVYAMSGCLRGFPWRLVLPMIVFAGWFGVCFALPLPVYLGLAGTDRVGALLQFSLATGLLLWNRFGSGRGRWLLARSDLPDVRFSARRLALFVCLNLFVVTPAVLAGLAVSASWSLGHLSRNFLRLRVDGVWVEARTYLCRGKRIYLLPTIHVAEPGFYAQLLPQLPAATTVLIPEGVTDREQILSAGLDYAGAARSLGLTAQTSTRRTPARFDLHPCDADVSEFLPATQVYLDQLGQVFGRWSEHDAAGAIRILMTVPEPDLDSLVDDLIRRRNERVAKGIRESMDDYQHIVVPWGAGHMPGLERHIRAMGGVLTATRPIRAWRWWRILRKGDGEPDRPGIVPPADQRP